jgi:hypothetical protein
LAVLEVLMVTAAERALRTALAAIALLALLAWQAPGQVPGQAPSGSYAERRQQRALELEVERDSLLGRDTDDRSVGVARLDTRARHKKRLGRDYSSATGALFELLVEGDNTTIENASNTTSQGLCICAKSKQGEESGGGETDSDATSSGEPGEGGDAAPEATPAPVTTRRLLEDDGEGSPAPADPASNATNATSPAGSSPCICTVPAMNVTGPGGEAGAGAIVHVVKMAVKLPMTMEQFNAGETQLKFRRSIASAAGVSADAVTINKVENMRRSGRRLMAASIRVDTSILAAGETAAKAMADTLTSDKINAELGRNGLPWAEILDPPKVGVKGGPAAAPATARPPPGAGPSAQASVVLGDNATAANVTQGGLDGVWKALKERPEEYYKPGGEFFYLALGVLLGLLLLCCCCCCLVCLRCRARRRASNQQQEHAKDNDVEKASTETKTEAASRDLPFGDETPVSGDVGGGSGDGGGWGGKNGEESTQKGDQAGGTQRSEARQHRVSPADADETCAQDPICVQALREAKALLHEGMLSQEEFDAEKEELVKQHEERKAAARGNGNDKDTEADDDTRIMRNATAFDLADAEASSANKEEDGDVDKLSADIDQLSAEIEKFSAEIETSLPMAEEQAQPALPEETPTGGGDQPVERGAAPSWEDAVPFTLTLDVDFATIGDQEDFKQDILADVAAAAKVDVKYVKIQELRAGSVIADLLIAPEVGEPHKVLQDLREQANSPGSRLMMGKLTSKTKGLATPAQPPPGAGMPQQSSPPARASPVNAPQSEVPVHAPFSLLPQLCGAPGEGADTDAGGGEAGARDAHAQCTAGPRESSEFVTVGKVDRENEGESASGCGEGGGVTLSAALQGSRDRGAGSGCEDEVHVDDKGLVQVDTASPCVEERDATEENARPSSMVLPTLAMPDFTQMMNNAPRIPSMQMPEISMQMPAMSMQMPEMPEVKMPEIKMPEFATLKMPELDFAQNEFVGDAGKAAADSQAAIVAAAARSVEISAEASAQVQNAIGDVFGWMTRALSPKESALPCGGQRVTVDDSTIQDRDPRPPPLKEQELPLPGDEGVPVGAFERRLEKPERKSKKGLPGKEGGKEACISPKSST